jgi:CP family cyanate transporter-like MFS transporter
VTDEEQPVDSWLTPATVLRLAGVLAVGAVLRPSIAGVGPVIDDIQDGLRLPSTAISLLTALPLVCFGLGSFASPALARRLGLDRSLGLVLGVLAAALLVRTLAGPGLLFTGTVFSGAAIAVMNTLLPRLVKQDFPERAGLVTGLYTSMLGVSASISALIAVPLESWTHHGWQGSLFVWGVVGLFAFVIWSPQAVRRERSWRADAAADVPAPRVQGAGAVALLRNRVALALTAYMALQSISFYVCLSWLPSLLEDAGYSATASGAYLSVVTALGIPMSLVVPALAARRADQVLYAVGFSVIVWFGFLGLLIAPGSATYVWVVLLGIGTASTFPLTLLMIVLRSSTPVIAGQLSAMVQGFGYLICAIGPFAVGELHDAFDSWRPSMIFMLVLVAIQAVSGAFAGRAAIAA